MSPLDMAVVQGCLPVLKAILRHGVNVDTRQMALSMAARHNQPDAIDVNVDGADIQPDTHAGYPALLSAASSSLALLKRGASARVSDAIAMTPLHYACIGRPPGLERAVDLLQRWGADPAGHRFVAMYSSEGTYTPRWSLKGKNLRRRVQLYLLSRCARSQRTRDAENNMYTSHQAQGGYRKQERIGTGDADKKCGSALSFNEKKQRQPEVSTPAANNKNSRSLSRVDLAR